VCCIDKAVGRSQGGSQEIAVMIIYLWKNFNNNNSGEIGIVKCDTISPEFSFCHYLTITAICCCHLESYTFIHNSLHIHHRVHHEQGIDYLVWDVDSPIWGHLCTKFCLEISELHRCVVSFFLSIYTWCNVLVTWHATVRTS